MTTYLTQRPAALPVFPVLDLAYADSRAKSRAMDYLEQTASPALLQLDLGTQAVDRPGLNPEAYLTDRAYAQLVVEAARHDEAFVLGGAPSQDIVNKLRIGNGQAALNSQLLRSSAFSRPALGIPLPIVADRSSYSIELGGLSPAPDHLDALLYAISRINRLPSLELGVPVSFTSHQFLSTFGWAVNSSSYQRMYRTISDLERIRLTFHDRSRPSQGKTHISRLFSSVTMPHPDSVAQLWTVVISGNLFRIFDYGRNSVVDLEARAAIRGEFGRWLHQFFSTQKRGMVRTYDAEQLCRAGGLRSARLADDLKQLRAGLLLLETGAVPGQRIRTRFEPLLEPGWSLAKDKASRRYMVRASRSA
jgi:hypothetical protein